MITIVLGTRAQLIKMAPLILEFETRAWNPRIVLTGQHKVTIQELIQEFGIQSQQISLFEGPEVTGVFQVPGWFAKCLWRLNRESTQLLGNSRSKDIVLVHGDTFSTLLGAVAGRIAGVSVGHVESGLRSFDMFHPFPEELTRLAVFRLSDWAFCPDNWTASNLSRFRLKIVQTGGNTLLDALKLALKRATFPRRPMPHGAFGVVSIHRFENIFQKRSLQHILSMLEIASERFPLVFVLHPATQKNLEKFGLLGSLLSNPRISLWPRMSYFEFVSLISKAALVITDGGSNQEELSYLGIPTLLMRRATERQEGLGTNVVLSGYDQGRLVAFLDDVEAKEARGIGISSASPCAVIADALADFA